MKIWIVILIMLTTSCNSDNPLFEVDDYGIPAQTYPSTKGDYCYNEIISSEIRMNIASSLTFLNGKPEFENLKKKIVIDNTKSKDEKNITDYDKYGNIISCKIDSSQQDFRYKFNEIGQVVSTMSFFNGAFVQELIFFLIIIELKSLSILKVMNLIH